MKPVSAEAITVRQLSTTDADFDRHLSEALLWSADTDAAIEQRVAEILVDVRQRGDAAVLDYTARFDQLQAASVAELEISQAELRAALSRIPEAQRSALQQAAARVRQYHQQQFKACGQSWQMRDGEGSLLGQKVTPLDRVGIYVPGGKAAYPSSVLMNAIPAQVAGVGEIVMVVPTPRGERNDLVLAAACVAGAHRVFTIGGAQAVAALAFGTATVPRVDKITGPGNAYVASAKRRVFGQVGIDMIAGPSEILVLADGSTPPDWVAMDLFSQAEHDELAQSILLSPDADFIRAVQAAITRLLPQMPRRDVIRASLEGRGLLVHTRSMEEACAISNRIAPEHLEVSSTQPHRWEPLLKHAGAIFLGAYTSESLGDYCAGPNHVLPTSGTARFSSPLGVYDFQKRSSLIEVSAAGAHVLGPIAAELAYGEGLQAHAQAAEMRLGARASDAPRGETAALAETLSRVLRQDVASMHAYAVQPSAGMVKLDTMENPHRLPLPLQRLMGERLAAVAINRYPAERTDDLRLALARHAGLPEGCALTLGNGSDELISMLSMACDVPGAVFMAPVPSFVMYAMSAQLQGIRFVGVPLTAELELDEPAMLAAIAEHQPTLLYLAYPNNPTANLWDEAVVERLAQAMAVHRGLLVMDEAYQPFAARDSMGLLRRHPHVLVMRTMSKLGLAGVRIGYLMARSALIAEVDKLRPPFNISVLNAEAALFALEHAEVYAEQARLIVQERQRLFEALQQLPGARPFRSDANMVLVRLPGAAQVFAELKARRILVKHVAGLHPLLADCLRLTVGTAEENAQLIDALRDITRSA